VDHIEALHDLGYLPIRLKALPEGSRVPLRVPFATLVNTDHRFFWVTNYLETVWSTATWMPITNATIAYAYRQILDAAAATSSDLPGFVDWQGHDFSMRGQSSIESARVSGAAHLLSFTGTDTIPAIDFLEEYYQANAETELIGGSVAATEHSVMCMGGQETELETYRRLIETVYPKGIVSIVSDTWDYWKILTEVLPTLKATILAREGKVVIRPDSGDPLLILTGDPRATPGTPAQTGTMQLLWDLFGGTINSKGYKQLDPHIGVIYGDSITLDRAKAITARLLEQGFASTNVVFGIGSFTYQYVTRDTFGMAIKATAGVIDGTLVALSKDPVTDTGLKKSARGLLMVTQDNGAYTLHQEVTPEQEDQGALEVVFENGVLVRDQSLAEIRARLRSA
jgi:nicotinamide phosphoribosyltransferase